MHILVTGSSGFIGYHLSKLLLNNNCKVVGLDNHNSYYDIKLKKNRNSLLLKHKNFKFYKVDLQDSKKLETIFKNHKIKCVINLAAQAGVRYSLINPKAYIDSNINGFFNILDLSNKYKVKKFIYASTSSIYGKQNKFPLKENFKTDNPIQLYAATKKSNEVMATAYSNLYKIKTVGLRFFTVYGPWGRPDMALFKFTKNIIEGKKINLFNKGNHIRDFTYIDDIVEAIFKLIVKKNFPKQKIYNVGNGKKIPLRKYIKLIEKKLKKKSKKNLLPLQKGDVIKTHADITYLKKDIKFKPYRDVEYGINKFVDWYLSYYK